MEKLRCNSPLFYASSSCNIVHSENRGWGGVFVLFRPFVFLTKYRSSHQRCTLVIMRPLSTKNLTIYKTQRWCECSPPDFFFLPQGRDWLETQSSCAGRDWAGDQAKGRVSKKKQKYNPGHVRIYERPTSLYIKHSYTIHVPWIKMWEHCAGLLSASLDNGLSLFRRHHSKTTSMSILFGCVVKHVWGI